MERPDHYGALRQLLKYAATGKAIIANPAIDAELPSDKSIGRSKPEPHFLTPHEVGGWLRRSTATHRTDS